MENKTSKEMYYIHNGSYVGNDMMWWGINSRGYTADLKKAGRYSKQDAEAICSKSDRSTAWSCDYIDNNIEAQHTVVDMQYLEPTADNFIKSGYRNNVR